MNQGLALKVLSEIMKWDDERAGQEFAWLKLMSSYKYDSYQDFVAGMRFIESLTDWLQQFEASEREIAYGLVRQGLIYIGPAEIQHLVELTFPETVRQRLLQAAAERSCVPLYAVWRDSNARSQYETLKRKSLFLALSDGARIDTFRRTNVGILTNEQVVVATQINIPKWDDLLRNLRKDLQDNSARFEFVFLIDDFVGSGTTLIRDEGGQWKGKLPKFWDETKDVLDTHFEESWVLRVHHYIGTTFAKTEIIQRHNRALADSEARNWFQRVEFSFGCLLDTDVRVDHRVPEFVRLACKYYDSSIQTVHTELGGKSVHMGFGNCALPLVIEHNTPNNSVALLWAETEGTSGAPAMRPLFRRRERHT